MKRIAVALLVLVLALERPPVSADPQEASVELHAASDEKFVGSMHLWHSRSFEDTTCFHVDGPLNLPSDDPLLISVLYSLERVGPGCRTTGRPSAVMDENPGFYEPRVYSGETDQINNNPHFGDCMPHTSITPGARNSILGVAVVIYSMASAGEHSDFRRQDHKHSPLACGVIHPATTSKDDFLERLGNQSAVLF